jgi:hypothetical protein
MGAATKGETMKRLALGLMLFVGACGGPQGSADVTVFQGEVQGALPAAQPDPTHKINGKPVMKGVFIYPSWGQVYPRETARVREAKTAQEWEDAINAHPLAGNVYHDVKGVFNAHKPAFNIPDCHANSSAVNYSSPITYIDGTNHANDFTVTYQFQGSTDQYVAYDDTCTQIWSVTAQGHVSGGIGGDQSYFGGIDTAGYLTVFTSAGSLVSQSQPQPSATEWQWPWFADETGETCTTCGHHAIYYNASSVLVKGHIVPGSPGSVSNDWSVSVGSTIHSQPIVTWGSTGGSCNVNIGNHVWVASDDGKLRIYSGDGTLQAGPTTMCSGLSCAATDQVWSAPVFDLGSDDGAGGCRPNMFYYSVSNKLRAYTYDATNGCSKSGSTCTLTASATLNVTLTKQAASPRLSFTSTGTTMGVMVPYRGKVYYYQPYTSGASLTAISNINVNDKTTPTATIIRFGSTFSAPMATPTFWGAKANGDRVVLLGDEDGRMNRYVVTTSSIALDTTCGSGSSNCSRGSGGTAGSWDGTVACTSVASTMEGGSTGATQYGYFNCNTGASSSSFIQFDPLGTF